MSDESSDRFPLAELVQNERVELPAAIIPTGKQLPRTPPQVPVYVTQGRSQKFFRGGRATAIFFSAAD